MESERLLTVKQIADRLGISVRKVWRDVAAGILPGGIKLGKRTTRWRESEIIAFIERASRRHAH
jgi:excisionase family DNA binding protein